MRILVVEDEGNLVRMMREVLEDEGYRVDVEADGDRGLEKAVTGAYDVIVLDVMLPGQDGYRVCRRLRQAGVATPVLMLTARGEVADRVRGLDAGADDYLVKPFDYAELLARLRALGRRPPAYAASDRLEVGDVVLDRGARRVYAAGREVHLTRTEFALLELLMLHPGRVLSREVLTERVWGPGYDPRGGHLDTYVHFLRRKLGRGRIRAVRGVGYALETRGESGDAGHQGSAR